MTKKELNKEIRKYIKDNPKLSNREVGEEFGVSWRSVRANRAHITMGTDTDTPQPRKKSKKRKKTIKGTKFKTGGMKKIKQGRPEKVNAILNSGLLNGLIATLCGETLLIELMLYTRGAKDFKYDLVEQSEEVFNKILRKLPQTKLDVNSITKNTMGSVIFNAHEDKYSHLILDYCGRINTFQSEIEMAINNNIVKKGGVIAMTFATRGAKPIIEVDKVEGEAIGYTSAKKYFETFDGYKLINSFKYKDSGDMMVFIIQREK